MPLRDDLRASDDVEERNGKLIPGASVALAKGLHGDFLAFFATPNHE